MKWLHWVFIALVATLLVAVVAMQIKADIAAWRSDMPFWLKWKLLFGRGMQLGIELAIQTYWYGMRLRCFSPGCQPMDGLGSVIEGIRKYHNILIYNRELTDEEVRDYELDRIPEEGYVNANNT